ncbi:winged helix-turn-helix transcriptional regulator [Salmonella enterica subsp. enterica serovar Typhimurium]|nr:winged helix-turn-helix transcriptional regulator [Salmonella enterica subsp. enterica serovar Typhimurium]EKM0745876.1 FaeA/PapI family transcriptional regulator [Escherichia coli]
MKLNVLSYIQKAKHPCSTTEIAAHCGISIYQARYYLMCLEKEGIIKRSPLRRGARTLWIPIDTE